MKPWLKNAFVYIGKNAVNAALLSMIQIYHDPADNNFQNWHGIKGILWQIGAAVGSRELIVLFTVYIPKLLKWSTTNGGNNAQKPN